MDQDPLFVFVFIVLENINPNSRILSITYQATLIKESDPIAVLSFTKIKPLNLVGREIRANDRWF